jgi:hypothetical protein
MLFFPFKNSHFFKKFAIPPQSKFPPGFIYTQEATMAIYHAKDNSFKLILGNHELFVEFLRDFIPVDILKSVRPEDIEDVSTRLLPLFDDNRDSDTVKQINLKDGTPFFVIALVEHESKVNFRSSFKMLQYICHLLGNYEKEVNRDHPGLTQTRDFRYPPILPIIFYDGPTAWTAELNFLDRTDLNAAFYKYIPKFEYELVDLNRYTREEITRFGDVLSLVMLIDKAKTWEGISLLSQLPQDYIEQLSLKIPQNLVKLVSDVITVLLDRLKYPVEEIREVTEMFEKKEYPVMFEALVENVLEERRLARELGLEEGRQEGTEAVFELLDQGYTPQEAREILKARNRSTSPGQNSTETV